MKPKRELERRLRDLPAPDEQGAEERGWAVVRAAHSERDPVRRRGMIRPLAVAAAVTAVALGIGLSPAGARVADLVGEVIGAGAEDPEPALTSLPAAGELLVESGDGAWIVREDGSKRRLGDYDAAAWSPHARYVAAATGRQLAAVDPLGEARWTVTAPGPVADPRWWGTDVDTRIAYRSGDQLRVVGGDGTGDARLADGVPPVAPAWLPAPEAKLAPPDEAEVHVLAYASSPRRIAIVDTGSGDVHGRFAVPGGERIEEIAAAASRTLLLVRTGDSLLGLDPDSGRRIWRSSAATNAAAISPDGARVAAITEPDHPNGESRLLLIDAETGVERRLPAGLGRFSDVAWSPDGRWLLLAWREADQWLFVRIRDDRPRRMVAVGEIASQFAPGADQQAPFPRIAGWLLPDRR